MIKSRNDTSRVIAGLTRNPERLNAVNPQRSGDAGIRRHDGAVAAQSRKDDARCVIAGLPRTSCKAQVTRNLFILAFLVLAFFSCANDMEVVNKFIDTEAEPDLTGINVTMLHTDSARLQTKMVAPVLKRYSSAKEQRDECPKGLHIWFYEKTGELKAELSANWAKHDITTNIWEARSNVVVTNVEGKKLETEQLFWEPNKGIVRSEKYTKITNEDGTVLTGNTFTANQDFTKMRLVEGTATIILKDEEEQK